MESDHLLAVALEAASESDPAPTPGPDARALRIAARHATMAKVARSVEVPDVGCAPDESE